MQTVIASLKHCDLVPDEVLDHWEKNFFLLWHLPDFSFYFAFQLFSSHQDLLWKTKCIKSQLNGKSLWIFFCTVASK